MNDAPIILFFQFIASAIGDFIAVLGSIPLYGNVNLLSFLVGVGVFKLFLIFIKTVVLESDYGSGTSVQDVYNTKKSAKLFAERERIRENNQMRRAAGIVTKIETQRKKK